MIRVGTIKYKNGKKVFPNVDNYEIIEVMTPSTKYGKLGPYSLTVKYDGIDNVNMENAWQFSKIYKSVPYSIQKYSKYDNTIIWEHPAEEHIDENDNITKKYWDWRRKGMLNKYAVRYPVGFN